jgi:hypothetical protein
MTPCSSGLFLPILKLEAEISPETLVPEDKFTCHHIPLTPDASLTYKVPTLSVGLPNLTHTCSNPASSMGTKKVARSVVGQMGVGDGTQLLFCFLPKGRRFADVVEVQRESLAALDSIYVVEVRQCFQQWEWRPDRCIQSQGELL